MNLEPRGVLFWQPPSRLQVQRVLGRVVPTFGELSIARMLRRWSDTPHGLLGYHTLRRLLCGGPALRLP